MKALFMFSIAILFSACEQNTTQPNQPTGQITAHVYYEAQGIPGVVVVLKPADDTLRTDSNGIATFHVAPGHYVVQAFGLTGPGPALRNPADTVDVHAGETTKVEFFDCLPCLN